MILTRLKPPKLSENTISAFGGINKTPATGENSFSNTQNTTAVHFPLLSTREKRLFLCNFDAPPSSLHTVNGITLTIKNYLYHNGVLQFDGLSDTENKQIVSMGSSVIVFPDGYYINTMTKDDSGVCTEKGFLTQKNVVKNISVKFIPCLADRIPDVSPERPTNPKDQTLWLDTSTIPDTLLLYSSSDDSWTSVAPSYICIKATGIDTGLNIGDGIEISGAEIVLYGANTVVNTGDGYIIVQGSLSSMISVYATESYPVTVERFIPELDFVCEHQNRLFGCRYGKNRNGDFVNEIYASKLGDPKNWNCFTGLSTDSYTASCGSEGEWTGIISHMGYVVFFKENRIHRLFGTKPSNFNLYQDDYPGVKRGSEKSLCIFNGTLFYQSENGIYSYSGGSPVCVSNVFGNEKYSNATAAICKNIYYVCMTDSFGKRQLFTYDTVKNLWHREDSTDYSLLSYYDGNILGVKKLEKGCEFDLLHSSEIPPLCQQLYSDTIKTEDDFEWFAQSGKMGLTVDDCKFINKLKVRLEADIGSTVTVYIELDSNGVWEKCGSFSCTKLTPFVLDIIPPRCDHFCIKICGRGRCKIYSLTKVIESASEVF